MRKEGESDRSLVFALLCYGDVNGGIEFDEYIKGGRESLVIRHSQPIYPSKLSSHVHICRLPPPLLGLVEVSIHSSIAADSSFVTPSRV